MWFFKKYHDKNNYMWNQYFSKITHFQENDVEDGLSDLDLKVNSVSVTNVKVKMLQKYFGYFRKAMAKVKPGDGLSTTPCYSHTDNGTVQNKNIN